MLAQWLHVKFFFSQYHLHCSTLSNKVCRARSFWVTAGSYEEISAIANGEGRNYIEKMLSRLRCRQKEEESVAVELVSSFSGWPGWFVFWNRPTPTHFSQLWTDTGPLGASEGARGRCVLFPLSLHGHIEHPLRTAWPRQVTASPVSHFWTGRGEEQRWRWEMSPLLSCCSSLPAPQAIDLFIKSHVRRPRRCAVGL